MHCEALCDILNDAGLANADECQALKASLDPTGATLQQLATTLRRDADELVEALENAVSPTLEPAELTSLPHVPDALSLIAPHDAWDYLILPVEIDADGTLLCLVCRDTLSLALSFLLNHTGQPFRMQCAEAGPLEQYIAERYAYEGINDAA